MQGASGSREARVSPVTPRSVWLAFGSNLGDRKHYIAAAVQAVDSLPATSLQRQSEIIETDPVGVLDQPRFLNGVAEVETGLAPESLLKAVKAIEGELGRLDRGRWNAREIDIDILFYDRLVYRSDTLTVPHPEMHKRRFVLEPMNQLAPDFVHPVLGRTIASLLSDLDSDIRTLNE